MAIPSAMAQDPAQALLTAAANQPPPQPEPPAPETGPQTPDNTPPGEDMLRRAFEAGQIQAVDVLSQQQMAQNIQAQDQYMANALRQVRDPRQREQIANQYGLYRQTQELSYQNAQLQQALQEVGSGVEPLLKERVLSDIAKAEGVLDQKLADIYRKHGAENPIAARAVARAMADMQKLTNFQARAEAGVDNAPSPSGQSTANASIDELRKRFTGSGDLESFARERARVRGY